MKRIRDRLSQLYILSHQSNTLDINNPQIDVLEHVT